MLGLALRLLAALDPVPLLRRLALGSLGRGLVVALDAALEPFPRGILVPLGQLRARFRGVGLGGGLGDGLALDAVGFLGGEAGFFGGDGAGALFFETVGVVVKGRVVGVSACGLDDGGELATAGCEGDGGVFQGLGGFGFLFGGEEVVFAGLACCCYGLGGSRGRGTPEVVSRFLGYEGSGFFLVAIGDAAEAAQFLVRDPVGAQALDGEEAVGGL